MNTVKSRGTLYPPANGGRGRDSSGYLKPKEPGCYDGGKRASRNKLHHKVSGENASFWIFVSVKLHGYPARQAI